MNTINPLSSTSTTPQIGFFGSSSFSIVVLDELARAGTLPCIVITMEDKPQGRGLTLTPNVVKTWALARNIPVLTPEKLKDSQFEANLKAYNCNVFVVASYGKIIPEHILYLPPRKTLNVHPSLLPAYRGAAPVQAMILADEQHPGVSIMELDKEMDHGPIVAQKEIVIPGWPLSEESAKTELGKAGGALLAEILPDWIAGNIEATPQDHSKATYTKKIIKEDGLLDLTGNPRQNYLKILAYHHWPKAYFFDEYNSKKIRLVVTAASFIDNTLVIEKVIPEGKKEMLYKDYLRGKQSPSPKK